MPAKTACCAASLKPLITAAMSPASIALGTSRVVTSGTRDGASSGC